MMGWRRIGSFGVVVWALASCQVTPADTWTAASRHAEAGRFLQALEALDRLAPTDAHYPQARTLAQALERRIRTSEEKVLEGLALRAEWRDSEAVRRFAEALEIWSNVQAARRLKIATENRIVALAVDGVGLPGAGATAGSVGEVKTRPLGGRPNGEDAIGEDPIGEVMTRPIGALGAVPPAPAGESEASPDPSSPGLGTAVNSNPDSSATTAGTPPRPMAGVGDYSAPAGPVQSSPVRTLRQRILSGQARKLLIHGDMDRALGILEDLWDEAPGDRSVARQLVRVLHQRALLAYGQGRLEAAVDDWKKVVRLKGGNAQAQAFLRAAETELAARKKR